MKTFEKIKTMVIESGMNSKKCESWGCGALGIQLEDFPTEDHSFDAVLQASKIMNVTPFSFLDKENDVLTQKRKLIKKAMDKHGEDIHPAGSNKTLMDSFTIDMGLYIFWFNKGKNTFILTQEMSN